MKATLKTDPADAIVRLEDSEGERIKAAADGTYSLMPGDKYTYTVTKTGYVGQSDELCIDKDTVKEIKLEKAPFIPNRSKPALQKADIARNTEINAPYCP